MLLEVTTAGAVLVVLSSVAATVAVFEIGREGRGRISGVETDAEVRKFATFACLNGMKQGEEASRHFLFPVRKSRL